MVTVLYLGEAADRDTARVRELLERHLATLTRLPNAFGYVQILIRPQMGTQNRHFLFTSSLPLRLLHAACPPWILAIAVSVHNLSQRLENFTFSIWARCKS
jgi:hypothetical protein